MRGQLHVDQRTIHGSLFGDTGISGEVRRELTRQRLTDALLRRSRLIVEHDMIDMDAEVAHVQSFTSAAGRALSSLFVFRARGPEQMLHVYRRTLGRCIMRR